MAKPNWREQEIFTTKISAYLESHRKILAEFERSLRNSRHFIGLAQVAREKEPDNTVSMLEQIQEIDMLGHVTTQFEAFCEISDLLPEDADNQETLEAQGDVEDLRGRYELMLEEAELQQETIRELMDGLELIA